jgi:hypothetical protein
MSRRLLAVALAVLMIVVPASVLVASSPSGTSERTAAPAVAVSPAGPPTFGVTTTDQYGNGQDTFEPGTYGTIYFKVTDPAFDTKVFVNISDTNASRDGLTNPVASWVVNVSSGWYNSSVPGVGYTLPLNLVYGGSWNISAHGKLGGTAVWEFLVRTFDFSITNPQQMVLAGHPGSVQFYLLSVPGGTGYTKATSVNFTGSYYDGVTHTYRGLTLSASSFAAGTTSGAISFLLPSNASRPQSGEPGSGYININGWANVSSDGLFSSFAYAQIQIANLVIPPGGDWMNVACECTDSNAIFPSSQVTISFYLSMEGSSATQYVAPNVTLSFNFWSAGVSVPIGTVPGAPPASVVTNQNGAASILFIASPTVFSTTGLNQLNISVTVLPSVDGSTPTYYNTTWVFTVFSAGTSGVSIIANFNSTNYWGGEAGSIAWSIAAGSGGTTAGWTGLSYSIFYADYPTQWLVAQGTLTGTSGKILFTAPSNASGELLAAVYAHNQTLTTAAESDSDVTQSEIFVWASQPYYSAGNTIAFTVRTEGEGFTGATLYYTVAVGYGGIFASGTVGPGHVFWVTIPTTNPPPDIGVAVTAQSAAQGAFATGSTYLVEGSGTTVNVGISTTSKYSDGSFQPGQTLTVTWSIGRFGSDQNDSVYYVLFMNESAYSNFQEYLALEYPYCGFDCGYPSATLWTTTSNSSGSFQYTVPSASNTGSQTVYVVVIPAVGGCSDVCWFGGQVSYTVNPSPSALDMELGGGITLGWLILLVLILVVAVVVILMLLRGRRRSPKSPTATTTTQSMPPAAPPPSSGPATEWKEESSPTPASEGTSAPTGGDTPPPLPNPPAGAQ